MFNDQGLNVAKLKARREALIYLFNDQGQSRGPSVWELQKALSVIWCLDVELGAWNWY